MNEGHEIGGKLDRPSLLRYRHQVTRQDAPDAARNDIAHGYIRAGWFCVWISLIFPLFLFGAIFCGIQASAYGEHDEGRRIMIAAPVLFATVAIIACMIFLAFLGWINSSVMDWTHSIRP